MIVTGFPWFGRQIVERIQRLSCGQLATEAETDALLAYTEQLARVEQQAAEYEAQGKRHLAEILRQKAATISAENPGGIAERLLANVRSDQPQTALTGPNIAHDESVQAEPPPAPRRTGRPPKASPPSIVPNGQSDANEA